MSRSTLIPRHVALAVKVVSAPMRYCLRQAGVPDLLFGESSKDNYNGRLIGLLPTVERSWPVTSEGKQEVDKSVYMQDYQYEYNKEGITSCQTSHRVCRRPVVQ